MGYPTSTPLNFAAFNLRLPFAPVFPGRPVICVVKSMCFAPRRIENEHSIVFVGYYVDTCVKVDGEWKFKIRRWRPWAGQVVDGAKPWETGENDGGFIHTQGAGSSRPRL